ncbi:MAG: ribonuclease HII [Oscillospiraceae bacterium]|jgi:ribonuclease HII|nr:ribonuclease HII [Oscillospiraceae bacterium]
MPQNKNTEQQDMLFFEKGLWQSGFKAICGIDEAGRGPLAGPVCAAAVVLHTNSLGIPGVNDSKKLTEKRREELFDVIIAEAADYSIAFATVEEIEEINILNATMLAMQRAVNGLKTPADYVIIDGNTMPPNLQTPAQTIVKGDAKSQSIAAASILAKVTRDRLMLEYAKEYPQYFFEKHKGYGTKIHTEQILKYGASPIHRNSFLKKILSGKK